MSAPRLSVVPPATMPAASCWRCGSDVAELRVLPGTAVALSCRGVTVTRLAAPGGVLSRVCTQCGQDQFITQQAKERSL